MLTAGKPSAANAAGGSVAINYAPINKRAKLERALPQLRRQIHQILNLGHHAPATIANAFDLV